MGHWTDLPAVWHQAADNFGDGDYVPNEPADRMAAVNGIALHIAQGSGAGTVSWCANPSSDVGPHFVVDESGNITQMVDTDDYSWCQAAGNRYWLSVENAGWSGNPLTAGQIEANARILARAHQVYGVPLQATDSTSGRGLGWHGMGGADWGGHYDCPGEPIKAQRGAIIARAQQIIDGGGSTTMSELTGYDRRALDSILYMLYTTLATDSDPIISVHVVDGAQKTWPNKLRQRLVAIASDAETIKAGVADLQARPAPTATLTAEDRAAIATAAGTSAAAVIGARIDDLDGQIEVVRGLVGALITALGGVGGVLQTLQSVPALSTDDGSDASAS